jgi:hypothetical protein
VPFLGGLVTGFLTIAGEEPDETNRKIFQIFRTNIINNFLQKNLTKF